MSLMIPTHPTKFGSAKVTLNGAEIPSGRVWDTVKAAMRDSRPVDSIELAHVAMTARIYAMEPRPLLLHTASRRAPSAARLLVDNEDAGCGVFLIEELMRPRPLIDEYGLLLGICRSGETPQTVMELIEAASMLGKKPAATVDGRYFFHEDPTALHEKFGTKGDWLRLGVYFKRPGIRALNIPAF